MKITTPDELNGPGSPGYSSGRVVDPTRVKFEMMTYNPNEVPPKRASILGKIFRGIGNFASLGFLFGPIGAVAGLSAAGIASVGHKIGNKEQQQAAAAAAGPLTMSYPGLSPAPMTGYQGSSITPASIGGDQALDLVVRSRENALYSSSKGV